MLTCGIEGSQAAEPPADLIIPLHSVTVVVSGLPDSTKLIGAELAVWRSISVGPESALERVDLKRPTFDSEGKVHVDLAPGAYRFELIHQLSANEFVAACSPPVKIREKTNVDLRLQRSQEVAVTLQGKPLRIRRLAIRSIGPQGELKSDVDNDSPLTFWRTSGTERALRIVGTIKEARPTTAADWEESPGITWVYAWEKLKDVRKPAIAIDRASYNLVSFRMRPDTAAGSQAEISCRFPTEFSHDPIGITDRILINRDYLLLGYQLKLPGAAGAAEFLPEPYRLSRNTVVDLGGPLEASGWAELISMDKDAAPTDRLWWVLAVTDRRGHVLDTNASTIEQKVEAKLDDNDWTAESPISEVDAKALSAIQQRLKLRFSSTYPGMGMLTVVPQPFEQLRTDEFSFKLPGAWRFRAHNYLAKLERMKQACRRATARPGPLREFVMWRVNTPGMYLATAGVGSPKGGQVMGMHMPISGLAHDDPFEEPFAMCHEMLHNFGYGHDDAMTLNTLRAQRLFNLARWKANDDRNWLP